MKETQSMRKICGRANVCANPPDLCYCIYSMYLKEPDETIIFNALTAKCVPQSDRLVAAAADRPDFAAIRAGAAGLWNGAGDPARQPVLDSGAYSAFPALPNRANSGFRAAAGHAIRALSRDHCPGSCGARRVGERRAGRERR